ncbi:MAG: hypothetical protein JNK82_16105 [Myxococcaceae bacterium]|nr:hypothetical protein [Myxococcaceae bacterium]
MLAALPMKRQLGIAVSVAVGLVVALVVPIYPHRMMTRLQLADGGDKVEWSWGYDTFPAFFAHMSTMRPEEHAYVHAALHIVLALAFVAGVALPVWLVWRKLVLKP